MDMFDQIRESMQIRVNEAAGQPIFTTDASGLFETYLGQFPESERQYHNCHACRRFIETYGGLVTIGENGTPVPLLWLMVSPMEFFKNQPNYLRRDYDEEGYLKAFTALHIRVAHARVTGVFFDSAPVWGVDRSPYSTKHGVEFTHFFVRSPQVFYSKIESASQASARKLQDFSTLSRALSEFEVPVLEMAVKILEADHLPGSEKFVNQALWLLQIKKENHRTLRWRAVASAPEGWCHPRSSMIGTLLEDISAGMSFEVVKKRWQDKMHPLRYQRPQAPPKDGNIEQAEKLIEQLGLRPSLRRRLATAAEVLEFCDWRAANDVPEGNSTGGGVFDHLKGRSRKPAVEMKLPAVTMTWAVFQEKVLPTARQIEFRVPHNGSFAGMTTAVVSGPSLYSWPQPFDWYQYHPTSVSGRWGLTMATWVQVLGISRNQPWLRDATFFLLEGAQDQVGPSSAGIFPESLRAELHGVRSVVEAFSKNAKLEELHDGCGYICGKEFRILLRVNGQEYNIDRRE